jgi:hypothetical protein
VRQNPRRYKNVVNIFTRTEGDDHGAAMSEKKWYKPLYLEGYEAFRMGHIDCPFKLNTQKYREWMRGFNDAYFENLKGRRHA